MTTSLIRSRGASGKPKTNRTFDRLTVLNDVSVLTASDAIANRLMAIVDPSFGTNALRVEQMHQWIVGESAQTEEVDKMRSFIGQLETRLLDQDGDEVRLRAWSIFSKT